MMIAAGALPVMLIGSLTGRRINSEIGETVFYALFWTLMVGYSARLLWRVVVGLG